MCQCGGSDFSELLASPQPDDLSLFFIQLETMAGHPVADVNNALSQLIHGCRLPDCRRTELHLQVVSVRVGQTPGFIDNVEDPCNVQQE